MLYINTASEAKLVSVKRVKVPIKPWQTVDLDDVDVRFLGSNSAYIVLAKPILDLKAKNKAKREKSRARKRARLSEAGSNIIKKKAKSVIKKAIKKVVKKLKKEPSKEVLRALRKELKGKLEIEMNKSTVMRFAKDVLGIDAKASHTKEKIIKDVLSVAKDYGYKKALNKI